MKIETIALADIHENDYNPNRMPEDLFESLLASIRDLGYMQPIIVRPHDDGYQIVDGAHRFRALKQLGHTRAECVVVEDDEDAAKLRTLTMNRLRGRMDNFDVAKILKNYRPEIAQRYLAYTEKHRQEMKTLLERVRNVRLPRIAYEISQVVVEFLLRRAQADKVKQAIAATGEDRNKAIVTICENYLRFRSPGLQAGDEKHKEKQQ